MDHRHPAMTTQRYPLLLALAALVVIAAYLGSTTGLFSAHWSILFPIFALGPVAVVGMIALYERLACRRQTLLLRASIVLLIIAFALFALMVIVQQTLTLQFRDLGAGVGAPAPELWRTMFTSVNLVQLGMDVAFDVFYCTGMALLAIVVWRDPDYGRWLGGFGLVAAVALLALNLAAFPYVPAESGLVDLGPVTAVWWGVVIIRVIRVDRRGRPSAQVP